MVAAQFSLPGCSRASFTKPCERIHLQRVDTVSARVESIALATGTTSRTSYGSLSPWMSGLIEMQPGEAEDQRMVVAVGQERLHRQDAVGALAVLHHHRLAPSLRQPLGEQPGDNVHAAAGAERRDQADGVLRPVLR